MIKSEREVIEFLEEVHKRIIKDYCYYCDKDTEITVKEESIPMNINGTEFTFIGNVAYCKECGEEVAVPAISNENIRKANEKFREILGIIKVSEIDELLRKYDIGQKPLAKLLGWGEVTIIRYLQGLMPSKVYSEKLHELMNPLKMHELYEKNKDVLTEVAQKKVESKIKEAMIPKTKEKSRSGIDAIDVAKYFLKMVDMEVGESVTHLKLQKLVYYAQAWTLAFLGKPLFAEDFEAWQHGPVIPSLYFHFKDYSYNPIPKSVLPNENVFSDEEKNVLDIVWDVYSKFDAKHLEKISHNEKPWNAARGDCKEDDKCNEVISKEVIKEYYRDIKKTYNITSKEELDQYICSLRFS
jgi:uncharacterized phage-associated protein